MIISIYFTDKWPSMLNTIYLYISLWNLFPHAFPQFPKLNCLSSYEQLIKCKSNIISIVALWAQPVRGVATVQVVNYALWQRPSIDYNYQSEKWESAGIFLS